MGIAGQRNRSTNRAADARRHATIAVCAPEESIRARIVTALALAGYELSLACSEFEELIAAAPSAELSLVVLAYDFEPFVPAVGVSRVRDELADTPLIVVATGFVGAGSHKLVPEVLEGFVHERHIENALSAAVDTVLAGQLCIPETMRDSLAQPVFSHREKQVLELLLQGRANGEIAAELFLSESTVKSHLASAFRKLGVSSRGEAARCVLGPDSMVELRLLALERPADVHRGLMRRSSRAQPTCRSGSANPGEAPNSLDSRARNVE